LNETKRRIVDSCNRENTKVWITDGREIENYLDIDILKRSIATVHHHFSEIEDVGKWSNTLNYKINEDNKTRTANKVKVARAYVDNCQGKVIYTLDLKEKIKSINDFIEKSGS
jgi:transcriptional regulator NrdR family protein